MKIYLLGNPLLTEDSLPLKIKSTLEKHFPGTNFEHFDPSEETEPDADPVFIDTLFNGKKLRIIESLDEIEISPRNSPHDYDMPLYLGILLKLGKIKKFKLIGIPRNYSKKRAETELIRVLRNI